ncbi:MAG: hypothetical protein ACRDZX_18680, partial [Acidimicrobiales bacterium]
MKVLDRRRTPVTNTAGRVGEAIIPEARRLQRLRRGALVLSLVLVLVVAGVLVAVVGGKGNARVQGAASNERPGGWPTVDARAFAHQGLLAFASGGSLYVLDGRTEALRQVGRLRTGAEEPSFSHDGRWLAYIAAGKESSVYGGVEEAPYAPEPGPLVISYSDGSHVRTVRKVGEVEEAVWSPVADQLLVVSSAGYAYDGAALWVVSADGSVRRLVAEDNIYGAVWSPDGGQAAVAFGGSIPVRSLTLETYPAGGGRPTVWDDRYTGGVQWLVPLGWWKGQGIAAWSGGGGTAASGEGTLSGAELALINRPGALPRDLGTTPAVDLVPAAGSSTARLAFEKLLANSWGRTPWAKGQIEICAPRADRCSLVPEPRRATALGPTWSPDGRTLAFVEAAASSSPSFFPSAVKAWYASERLYLLGAGGPKAVEVPGSQGATAPLWSPRG